MSYIIAATDFSDLSENAVLYAARLAEAQAMDLVIINAFSFPVMMGDVPLPASLIDDTQADAERRIGELVLKVNASSNGTRARSKVVFGGILDAISTHGTENGEPWLVVMGNSVNAEDTAWFFSTLKDATSNLEFTVLAVPHGCTYTAPDKICLALDVRQPENIDALTKIAAISGQLKTALHVFNAQGDAAYENVAKIGTKTETILSPAHPHYHFRHLVTVDDAIQEFCSEEKIDWLALIPGKYSFFEELFHKSHTKALAKTMAIPLLILHESSNDGQFL
jgi:nucleotide-binding universal stress UspA family protein